MNRPSTLAYIAMKLMILFLSCLVSPLWPLFGQSTDRFAVQAGCLQSVSRLRPISPVLIGYPDVVAKPGFYVGFTYEHALSSLITGEFDLSYQQKGHISQLPYITPASINTYRYIGLTPMIGIRPLANVCFLLGPQINLLLSRSTKGLETQPLFDANRKVEFGLAGRVQYQFDRVGLSLSYVKGLTAYYKPENYQLTNQNWQVGLYYQLSKVH